MVMVQEYNFTWPLLSPGAYIIYVDILKNIKYFVTRNYHIYYTLYNQIYEKSEKNIINTSKIFNTYIQYLFSTTT